MSYLKKFFNLFVTKKGKCTYCKFNQDNSIFGCRVADSLNKGCYEGELWQSKS